MLNLFKSRLPRWSRWPIRFGYLLLVALLLYLDRAAFLSWAAEAWIVNDPCKKADAVLVLGGGRDTRPFEAARLYKTGVVPKILMVKPELHPSDTLGITIPEHEICIREMKQSGVPDSAIILLPGIVTSTFDESRVVKEWARSNQVHSIIIPTDLFHTRRVRWLFKKTFKNSGTDIQLDATAPLRYTSYNWWQHEEGLLDFQNEVVKFALYLKKY